jgi:glycosyltransferase involved in cell wall biosynthesis
MKTISVVTPCYNEEENIRECYQAVKAVFEAELPGYAREHVFCDNASNDATVAILREIAAADPAVKVILNARNFGPLRSNFNGVMAATGDAVLLFLPADLQDPPELVPRFVRLWEQGNEIVYGIRATRQEGLVMRSLRKIYYRVVARMSYIDVPVDVGDFQLADRKVVDAMRQVEDAYPFMRMMTFECGFNAVGIAYEWKVRQRGLSKNRLLHLIDQGMNGLVTFWNAPLRLALFAGFGLAAFSIVYAIFTFILALAGGDGMAPRGIPTLIVALFFFSGIQLFVLGLIGEYVLAIYAQVRKKPLVVERERINF